MATKIQWATQVWNPVTGCEKVSEGCAECYAEKFAKRLQKMPNENVSQKYRNGFKVTTHPESLKEPEKWKKPQRVFVCSMGDLFHEDVPFEFITKVFAVMIMHPQHTFMLLTKRAQRMKDFIDWVNPNCLIDIKNIWFGVTVENQERADERIPILLQINAAVRFISVEPMLGEVNLIRGIDKLDWVICGGETGHKARPMNYEWVKKLRDQCFVTETPFFFKQWGEYITIDRADVKKYPLAILKTDLHNHSVYARVGKKAAGHLIDGVEWNQLPDVRKMIGEV
jgi:protein gp37